MFRGFGAQDFRVQCGCKHTGQKVLIIKHMYQSCLKN